MNLRTLRMMNLICFRVALGTIGLGVFLCILLVWAPFVGMLGLFWQFLTTDIIVFAGAVLMNLAVKCYRDPGGAVTDATSAWDPKSDKLPTAEEYAAGSVR